VTGGVDRAAASPNTVERLSLVLELLEQQRTVQVAELAHRFDVSEVTVRSDLTRLAGQRLVSRFRGGARLADAPASEVGFDLRVRLREREKRAIARGAATMVANGEAIALDSSTTASYLALELRTMSELVVVTNGLRVAAALGAASGVTVIVPAGTFRPAAMSLVGDFAAGILRTMTIAEGFFGARGMNIELGLMDLDPAEVHTKCTLVDACERVIGVVDHSKWRQPIEAL
jgi:DeoR/GlpR family transcriptional regulator of sugar metabolism